MSIERMAEIISHKALKEREEKMQNSRFKFRAWCEETKRYYYFNIYDIRKYSLDEYDDDDIEQCTGLKDKNGRLIYEGDIVKFEKDISAVKWCINGFAIDDGTQYLVDDMDIEVIGNIHQEEE